MKRNTRKFRLALTALTLVALLLSVFGAVSVWAANTWTVDASFTDNTKCNTTDFECKDIQAAITAASDGDTINVAAGTYAEYLHINKDGLTIEATAGYTTTIIDLDGLTPFWEYGMLSSSFAGRAGVLISGYGNTGGTADLVEGVTFDGFTVQNAGVNTPKLTGTHDGGDNLAELTDSGAGWTPGALIDWYVTNASDYDDTSGGRQFFRAKITGNTADTLTTTYISGGDEIDWDDGDLYVITQYREWYDAHLDGRDDVRGIIVSSGKGITISDNRVEDAGAMGITTGRSRISPRLASENITIDGNTVTNNHGNGISVGDTKGTATITGNTVSTNSRPLGVLPPRDLYDHTTGIRVLGRGTGSNLLGGEISLNDVSDNQYIGISVSKYTDGFDVHHNTVTGHNLHWEGAGIFVSTGLGFTKHVQNHDVHDNIVTGNIRGIIAYYAWDSIIQNNTVTTDSGTFDMGQAAIKIDRAYNIQVLDNEISGEGQGIELTGSETTGNTISRNTVDGAMYAGVRIRSGAHDNTFTNNEIKNTIPDTFTEYSDWGTHDGGDGQAILTDIGKSWATDYFAGMTVINLTDTTEDTILSNTADTITTTTGVAIVWDDGDEYDIVFDQTKAVGVYLRGGKVYAGGHAGTGNVFNYNSIHDNGGVGMENGTSTTVDASGNWWGTSTPSGVAAEVSGDVDYTPWLASGTDDDPGTDGFQGDYSTLWVDDDSLQAGTTGRIQEGINEVSGSTVNVASGTYTETVSITKAVTLTGESESGVIVQANASGPVDGQNTFTINAAGKDVTIEYMTIRHGDYGIRSSAGNVNVLHSTLYHNGYDGVAYPGNACTDAGVSATHWAAHATNGGAIRIENSSGSEIAYNTVYENDRGIRYQGSDLGDIHHNVVHDNIQSGIYLACCGTAGTPPVLGSTNTIIHDNESYNNKNNGILSIGGKNNTIEDNDVHDNWNTGIMLWYPAEITIQYNIVDHNNLCEYNGQGPGDAKGGVWLESDVNAVGTFAAKILNNDITDNELGALAQTEGIRVGSVIPGVEIKNNNFSGHDIDVHVLDQAATTVVNLNSFGTDYGIKNDDTSACLDGESNWWGDASGPQDDSAAADACGAGTTNAGTGDKVSDDVDYDPWLTGVAPGTLQAVIDNASPGDVIQLGPYTYEGVIIDESITLQGQDGTVIGPGSAGVTVTAVDVIIEDLMIDGWTGSDNSSFPGILVQAGADNLTVQNCEIKRWEDGIEVAGNVTSLKVVGNWIHDNTDAGLQVDSGVSIGGLVTIEGNLFKNNPTGIQNNSASNLLAEYNSWGTSTGPTVVGTVDAVPFTFAEIYLDVAPDTEAVQRDVNESESFDVKLKVDAEKLYGLTFKFTYDTTMLTFNGTPTFAAPWAGSCDVIGTPPAGTFHYRCNLESPTGEWDGGTVATFNFTAEDNGGLTGNGTWATYFDIAHAEADTSAGAVGAVKVYVNNAGFGDASSMPDRDITDTDDGEITITGIGQFTGFVDLQGRTNDSGATITVYNQQAKSGATALADATNSAGGGYTTSYTGGSLLTIGTPYWFQVDAPYYLPTTATYGGPPSPPTDWGGSGDLTTRPLTTLANVKLLGGDCNDNDYIEILDAIIVGDAFGSSQAGGGTWDPLADINADLKVNILDAVLLGGNWHKSSSPWTP